MSNQIINEVVSALTKLDIMLNQNTKMLECIEKMVNEMYNAPPYGPGYLAAEKKLAFLDDDDEEPPEIVNPYDDHTEYPESAFAPSFL
jgi:hypothetical protein